MEVNFKKWMFYHLTEVTFYVNCVQLWYCSCSSENPCWVGGRRFWSTVSANPCWAGWRSLRWRRRSQTQQPLLSHRSSGSANPCWVGGEELESGTAKPGWLRERGAAPATHKLHEPDSEPRGYWYRVLLAEHCSGAIHWAEQRGVLLRSPWWSASILPIVQRSTNRADSLCESLYLVQYFIVRLYVKRLP